MIPPRLKLTGVLASLFLCTSICAGLEEILIVVEDEQHRPIKGATVWVVPCDRYGAFLSSPKSLQTDKTGHVKVKVSSLVTSEWECTHFLLWAVKGYFQSHPKTWSRQQTFKAMNLPLRLVLKTTVKKPLRVKVVNAKGKPVNRANVFLWRFLGSGTLSHLMGAWTTDNAGEVKANFRLPSVLERIAYLCNMPLQFFLLAYHPEEGWGSTIADTKSLPKISLSLSPNQQSSLKVQDCFGEPLKGLRGRLVAVQLPNASFLIPLPSSLFTSATDSTGKVTLPAPRSGKVLWEWSRNVPWGLKRTASRLWIDAGSCQTVQFHRRTIQVVGRLIEAQTKKPLVGECVILSVGEPLAMIPLLPFCAKTNEEGRFAFETKPFINPIIRLLLTLPDGRGITLWDATMGKQLQGFAFKQPLLPPRCQRWFVKDIALNPPTVQVIGKVVDEQGKPVPHAFVKGVCLKVPQKLKKAPFFEASGMDCEGSKWEISRTGDFQAIGWIYPLTYTFTNQRGQFQLKLRAGTWELTAIRTSPPHRPIQRIPANAIFLWPTGIGSISPTRKVTRVILNLSDGAIANVTLKLSGWTYIDWFMPTQR